MIRSLSLNFRLLLLATVALLVAAPVSRGQSSTEPAPAFSARDPQATKPARAGDGASKPKKDQGLGTSGPTEITSDESLFDEKTHTAIFLRNVYVKTGDLTISCDKLTAYLKHDPKKTGAPSTPKPKLIDTLVPGEPPRLNPPPPKEEKEKDEQASGLDRAFAEGNVEIIQDKVEADGKITRSVGHSKTALYESSTGDVTLRGKPDITQGINTTVALEESTVMVLNKNGHMTTKEGRVTTVLNELSEGAAKTGQTKR